MELKTTNHSYYCNDTNFYVGNANGENFGRGEFDTWKDFKEAWLNADNTIDHDYNHCFRFDIVNQYDEDSDEELKDKFTLKLYMMLQRKGIFVPVEIKNVKKEDMSEVEKYLKGCWEYISAQWSEVSNTEGGKKF